MKKYEYVYVREMKPNEDDRHYTYKDIINEYAEKGYRYVGYMPIMDSFDEKRSLYIDLIFEIEC